MSIKKENIEEATEILLMEFAKPGDIAWAWEILQNRDYQDDEGRYKRIYDKTKFIKGLSLPTRYEDGSPSFASQSFFTAGRDVRGSQYVLVEDVKQAAINAKFDWPIDVSKPAISAPEVIKSDIDKPWLVHNPLDPPPKNSWYTPARYFARETLKEKPLLINNKLKLAGEVATLLFKIKDYPRGRVAERDPSTVLKAFTKCILT